MLLLQITILTPKELRSRRIALHLATSELAKLLGLPTATVDAWERGEEPIENSAALARRLGEIEKRPRASGRPRKRA